MKSVNPGENGCGGEVLSGRIEGSDLIFSFLLGSHTRSEFTVTREI